jgi:tetratricopeptide (TPR) repeat protein
MDMDAGRTQRAVKCDVSEDAARAELERLLSDPRFHATDRAKKVLKYIADSFFAGETEGVKAYAIALDVLGRSSRFDPNTDPIVRIELSRLRSALAAYYEAYGSELDISIQLPIGRYLTIFSRSSSPSRSAQDGIAVAKCKPDTTAAGIISRNLMLITFGAAAVMLLAGWLLLDRSPAVTARPSVTIDMTVMDDRYQGEASLLHDYLTTALSKFRTINLVVGKGEDGTLAAQDPGVQRHAYHLQLKYYGEGDDRSVWWQILDLAEGEIRASGLEQVSVSGDDRKAGRDEMVSLLARKLAPSRGIISNIEVLGEESTSSLGNVCTLRAELALEEGTASDLGQAQTCLEQTLEVQPNDPDASATLARLLLELNDGTVNKNVLGKAYALARKAVSLDPTSDRAQVSLMMVQFKTGTIAPAIASGQRALSLNPENPDVLAKLAVILSRSGDRTTAISLALNASRDVYAVPRDARLVVALDAYANGDFQNAAFIAEQISRVDVVVVALTAAALGKLNAPAARERLEVLSKLMPDYETALPLWMDRRRFDPALAASLQAGLQMAKRSSATSRQDE